MEKIAILMADLSGYTAWTEIHGPVAAAEIIDRYCEAVQQSLTGEATFLERVGDQVVVTSPFAGDIAKTAAELYRRLNSADHFLPVHAGIHYGEVLNEKGHLFGSTINVCARLAAHAKEGKILCSSTFAYALANRSSYRFIRRGKFNFKNVLETTEVIEMNFDREDIMKPKYTDPVCHMQIDHTEKHYRLNHKNNISHFCSIQCMNIFQERSCTEVMGMPALSNN